MKAETATPKGKVDKYKNDKPLICSGCREQFSHKDLGKNKKDKKIRCPQCGAPIKSKVMDAKDTDGRVHKPTLRGQ